MFVPFVAASGGGHIVVLKASQYEKDWYNRTMDDFGSFRRITTLIFDDRQGAFDPQAASIIRQADALFIAGGDQSKYVNYWSGTPVAQAIKDHLFQGRPLGGTSAGLAIMGSYVFSAQNGGVTSDEALRDPFHPRITIEQGFMSIGPLRNLITDTHFSERDRLGRLVTFMFRSYELSHKQSPRGIGVDEGTVAIVDHNGKLQVRGPGQGYLFSFSAKPSLTNGRIQAEVLVSTLSEGDDFDLSAWKGSVPTNILIFRDGTIRPRE